MKIFKYIFYLKLNVIVFLRFMVIVDNRVNDDGVVVLLGIDSFFMFFNIRFI